jgi:hypothetical protein
VQSSNLFGPMAQVRVGWHPLLLVVGLQRSGVFTNVRFGPKSQNGSKCHMHVLNRSIW